MHYIRIHTIVHQEGCVMKNLFSLISTIVLISFLSIGGCGGSSGGGEVCDFNLSGIQNGPSFGNATSEWECNGPSNEFAFYQDGTGRDFSVLTTYQRVGCRTINFQDQPNPDVQGVYENLNGSKSEGILTFDRIFQGTTTFQDCTLRIFEDDDEFF